MSRRRENPDDPFWALNFGRRPARELYHLDKGPYFVTNLALAAEPESFYILEGP